MHHPVPLPPPPRQPAVLRAELASFLAPSLGAVVTGARRRALRDGDRQIDTAHLLHGLLETDPEVTAAFGDGTRLARVLGYLAQRSIGYGLRWQRSVEDSGAGRLLPAVRETASRDAAASGWSPAATTAWEGAFRRAAERGDDRVHGLDLLAVIAADPESRAAEVLRRAGVDPAALAAGVEECENARPRSAGAADGRRDMRTDTDTDTDPYPDADADADAAVGVVAGVVAGPGVGALAVGGGDSGAGAASGTTGGPGDGVSEDHGRADAGFRSDIRPDTRGEESSQQV
ncbi:Clp protease N-terminal domain-containing protein [Streptomyces sp. NPDC055055]